jgi:GNAT superfamily N-acetyltransferase
MIIKRLTEDYIEQYLECVGDLNNPSVRQSRVKNAIDILKSRPDNIITFMLLDANILVATATIIMEDKIRYKQKCCHIEDVAVMSAYRKKGYGKAIVEHCINYAVGENCYKVRLNCADHLIKFYSGAGFKNIDNGMVNYV